MSLRIAVASRDGRTIAGHIGKCASWIIFEAEAEAGGEVRELERMTLTKHFVFHHYKGEIAHPLEACSVVIGTSAGNSFVEKMQQRGFEVILTAEADPLSAVTDYLHQSLSPPRPRPIGEIICKIRDAFSG
ncbi:MAG: hypothetical protein CO186_04355 [Zetaproteobacteria bacterium CG_4_9_14_3_um_filter_49_83]|nr:MAG: hypothetical protein AUJ56_04755 [Zetaproteobacteria bacterium CG1_02_49_23]PIQ34814.1 MAG: hypothetical protein COW62_00620 [Zetaproteobacteria bacterium CG17_big_fil_post_rev_8_21_14_2_50_50_13]PIV29487.1 MAG: hypothetical protein COS35_11790 [Zetaproteobacteria bacterium CG02_land_8_20_14_3_00_50_9]PIY55473.1 MAG: hypothetical protein COZ00_09305 [Zetaproteobacteria bacterium CG_4_10_14_0_8_um_filter_49_80]PJA35737.1 MAG: hypothetical protein CO186_04355 [Zetaproteobacteria bacterium